MRHLRNIFNLGIKELRSLLGDKAMLTLIVFSFTVSVYSSATVTPGSLNLAPIAIADMDPMILSDIFSASAQARKSSFGSLRSAPIQDNR